MTTPRLSRLASALAALAALSGLAGCSGEGRATPTGPEAPAAQGVTVEVSPSTEQLPPGASSRFSALVTGTAEGRVTWGVVEVGGGTIDPAGVYTAPATVGDYHVRATSVADARAFGEALVRVRAPAVTVTVTPSPAAVDACRTVQLTATVQNAANRSVTWSVQEGAAGGTVSATGLYTAPQAPATYHVVATSVQDPTRSAVVAVTVSQHVLGVTVSPPSVDLAPGQTQQFTATVTSTCGTSTTVSSFTAPL